MSYRQFSTKTKQLYALHSPLLSMGEWINAVALPGKYLTREEVYEPFIKSVRLSVNGPPHAMVINPDLNGWYDRSVRAMAEMVDSNAEKVELRGVYGTPLKGMEAKQLSLVPEIHVFVDGKRWVSSKPKAAVPSYVHPKKSDYMMESIQAMTAEIVDECADLMAEAKTESELSDLLAFDGPLDQKIRQKIKNTLFSSGREYLSLHGETERAINADVAGLTREISRRMLESVRNSVRRNARKISSYYSSKHQTWIGESALHPEEKKTLSTISLHGKNATEWQMFHDTVEAGLSNRSLGHNVVILIRKGRGPRRKRTRPGTLKRQNLRPAKIINPRPYGNPYYDSDKRWDERSSNNVQVYELSDKNIVPYTGNYIRAQQFYHKFLGVPVAPVAASTQATTSPSPISKRTITSEGSAPRLVLKKGVVPIDQGAEKTTTSKMSTTSPPKLVSRFKTNPGRSVDAPALLEKRQPPPLRKKSEINVKATNTQKTTKSVRLVRSNRSGDTQKKAAPTSKRTAPTVYARQPANSTKNRVGSRFTKSSRVRTKPSRKVTPTPTSNVGTNLNQEKAADRPVRSKANKVDVTKVKFSDFLKEVNK